MHTHQRASWSRAGIPHSDSLKGQKCASSHCQSRIWGCSYPLSSLWTRLHYWRSVKQQYLKLQQPITVSIQTWSQAGSFLRYCTHHEGAISFIQYSIIRQWVCSCDCFFKTEQSWQSRGTIKLFFKQPLCFIELWFPQTSKLVTPTTEQLCLQ